MAITGETRLAAVIGDPVRHSRSPAIHNAGYAAAGLDWVFLALAVPAGRGAEAVAAMPVLGIAGFSVTMPHKADAAGACDELSADAAALGVVNTVVLREDGTIWGDSTDGEGLIRSLTDAGLDVAGTAGVGRGCRRRGAGVGPRPRSGRGCGHGDRPAAGGGRPRWPSWRSTGTWRRSPRRSARSSTWC